MDLSFPGSHGPLKVADLLESESSRVLVDVSITGCNHFAFDVLYCIECIMLVGRISGLLNAFQKRVCNLSDSQHTVHFRSSTQPTGLPFCS